MLFLLCDPEGVIPDSLEEGLRAGGHQVRREGGAAPIGAEPDTALLMGDSPDLDERVEAARAIWGKAPIMTVRNARDGQRSAELLNRGADDDLIQTTPSQEVLARVDAVRRSGERGRRGAQERLGITIFSDDRVPEANGCPLPLSTIEGRILSRLLRGAGRPVSRESLSRSVYPHPERAASERVIDVHVCHLRRKLRAALGRSAPLIRTVRGVGYLAGPG
jgi:two-component system cell cycle response regulator CtrA